MQAQGHITNIIRRQPPEHTASEHPGDVSIRSSAVRALPIGEARAPRSGSGQGPRSGVSLTPMFRFRWPAAPRRRAWSTHRPRRVGPVQASIDLQAPRSGPEDPASASGKIASTSPHRLRGPPPWGLGRASPCAPPRGGAGAGEDARRSARQRPPGGGPLRRRRGRTEDR